MSFYQSAFLVFVAALVVFLTRALPFIVFKGTAVIPKWLSFLGTALPGAVIAVLVVYCLRGMSFESISGFLPAVISVAAVAGLHILKHNNLLSIGGGTILYMVLVQIVF